MVDVTPKEPTHRRAVAGGRVMMAPRRRRSWPGRDRQGRRARGGPVAGIQAAKRTPDLIPLCHPLLVGAVLVNFRIEDDYIEVEAHVDTVDRTGWRWRRHRVLGRLSHDLRHVQVRGPLDGHQRPRAVGEDRWSLRNVSTGALTRLAGVLSRVRSRTATFRTGRDHPRCRVGAQVRSRSTKAGHGA